MESNFKEEDIGRRVLLLLDPKKIDDESLGSELEYEIIPYEAIKGYEFIPFVKTEDTPRKEIKVIDSSNILRKINPVLIAKGLGADEIRTVGNIVEVADNYLKIEVVKDRSAPWLKTKSRYTLDTD